MFNFYLPILKNLVLSVRSGGATLTGNPEFYQLNSLAGSDNLRGYRRDRFWGKTSFYNANELQWLFNFRSRIFNGKVGLFGLFDEGRVWQPGEDSNTWHTAYGAGIMMAPFNKLLLALSGAKAHGEDLNFHIRLVRPVGK
jgi:hemolysin activation/secretion protein